MKVNLDLLLQRTTHKRINLQVYLQLKTYKLRYACKSHV